MKLIKEQKGLKGLLKSDDEQWAKIGDEIKGIKEKFSKKTPLGKRRTDFAEAPDVEADLRRDADREGTGHGRLFREGLDPQHEGPPRGYLRPHLQGWRPGQVRGPGHDHRQDHAVLVVGQVLHARGLEAAGWPWPRRTGAPDGDLDAADSALSRCSCTSPGASAFWHPRRAMVSWSLEDECVANTRKGKQVLNVKAPVEAQVCVVVPETADHVATIGENRKLLIFKLAEVPEMARGKGVRLQKFKDGGLSPTRSASS
jgi:topoisomerase-4 subunit A